MATADYAVIFDISRDPYTDWMFGLLGLGLVIAGVIGAFWYDALWKRVATGLVAVSGLALTFAIIGSGWSAYYRLRADYSEGRFSVAEGRVQNFRPDFSTGKSPQTFAVDGRSFELWGATRPTPAFHRTVGSGGPNLADRCVRILYTDRNEIIWLGVKACEPDAAAQAVPS